ncbi:hypothetical protein ACC694_22240 [Rhizobium ruizarguesonis]
MSKKDKKRSVIKSAGPQPLYIIAGLPKAAYSQCVEALELRYPQAIFKGAPAASADAALYPNHYIETLIRSAGEFAVRRRANGNEQPTPASLILIFVPSFDQEELLKTFDFAVMPAPLPVLATRDDRGAQLRHQPKLALEEIVGAIKPSSDAQLALAEVRRRLAFQSDNEAILLPPGNFNIKDSSLRTVFREFRNGARDWTDRLTHLGPTDLKHEDVPSRIAKQQTRRPFVDQRGMAFFIAHPNAYDAPTREADSTTAAILSTLQSLYRFGGSIVSGLHHDAQRSDGSPLGGATFHCSEKGPIQSNEGYANVYPNDFVRVGSHTLVK